MTNNESVRDIGWAVKQLRARRAVRRAAWPENVYIDTALEGPSRYGMRVTEENPRRMVGRAPDFKACGEDLLADDWELA